MQQNPTTSHCHLPLAGRTSDKELSVLFQRVGAVVLVLGSASVEATLFLGDVSDDQCQRNGIVVGVPDE